MRGLFEFLVPVLSMSNPPVVALRSSPSRHSEEGELHLASLAGALRHAIPCRIIIVPDY